MGTFFKDDDFEFTTLLPLGSTYHKCTDVGQRLSTLIRIKNGGYEGWYREWRVTDQVRRFAERRRRSHDEREGGVLEGRNVLQFATSTLDGTSDLSLFLPIWEAHRECFDEAARSDLPCEKVEIPYEDTTLPGYFFQGEQHWSIPTVAHPQNGSDCPISDMYFQGGAAALERGYNALAFNGPGQGAALHLQGLYFRHD
jgi:hypothetical protein